MARVKLVGDYNETDIDKEILYKMKENKNTIYLSLKRGADILIGFTGTILTIPILVGVKVAYLIHKDYNPILFKQTRIGKNGKEIKIYKFRSMVPNADEVLDELMKKDKKIRDEYKKFKKLKEDPRITKVGHFLRSTSLDEFPQFINVLKGEMSVVGPRPYLHREMKDIGSYYEKIISCKPGLTGYWQVQGRSNTDFVTRLKMDSYYIDTKGLRLDTKLFFKTIEIVIKRNGAK